MNTPSANAPPVGLVMGSSSDWETMRRAADVLNALQLAFEARVVSAHRTPERLYDYGRTARSRGLKVIIAGAGAAAHLPGMLAALTVVPVLGVPIRSDTLSGLDSLLSIVQMPKEVAVGTLAIGANGAHNAALLAASILAVNDAQLAQRLVSRRRDTAASIPNDPDNNS